MHIIKIDEFLQRATVVGHVAGELMPVSVGEPHLQHLHHQHAATCVNMCDYALKIILAERRKTADAVTERA